MKNARMLTASAVLSALWGGLDGSSLPVNMPNEVNARTGSNRNKRSGVAAAKRQAQKRKNVRARNPK